MTIVAGLEGGGGGMAQKIPLGRFEVKEAS